jgi:transposase
LAQGKTTKQIVEYTGYGLSWIRTIAHRYNEGGPQALGDRRHNNPGAAAILSADLQQQLREELQSPPADQGLWTGRKVAAWIREKTGHSVHPQRGCEYLRRLGGTLRVPRIRHAKADPTEQEAFKKLPEAIEQVQQAAPEATVELWAYDEHRIGLKPIVRRVWVFNGQRPTAVVQHRYQWLYVYAFVHPRSGQTQWLLLPTVNVDVFTLALRHFAQAVGASTQKQIVLVLDRAGWHTSQALIVPEGLHLLFLPPYSPELQPAEHLWPLSNEPLIKRHFSDLAELEELQAQRCVLLQDSPELIRSQTSFRL